MQRRRDSPALTQSARHHQRHQSRAKPYRPSSLAPQAPSFETWCSVRNQGGAGGCTQSKPCSDNGNVEKNGEPIASGWTAEHTSWRNPGSVRAPPPIVSLPAPTTSAS